MPTSQCKLESNRRNAQRSTGPRTPAGKQQVRRNAITHGLYTDPKILPAEDHGQHAQLTAGLRQMLQPQGPMEEVVFQQIASALIELTRMNRAYDAYLTALVKRCAIARECREEFQTIRDEHTHTPDGIRQANEAIERIHETEQPCPEAADLDKALLETLSNPRDVTITANADRRKRQLLRDYEFARATFKALQAERLTLTNLPRNNSRSRPQQLDRSLPSAPEPKRAPRRRTKSVRADRTAGMQTLPGLPPLAEAANSNFDPDLGTTDERAK